MKDDAASPKATGAEDDPRRQWCMELKPAGYLPAERKAPGKQGRLHVLHVGRAERRLAEAAPEPCNPDFTGRYEDGAAQGVGEGPQFLMHINQAGKHIEGLFVMINVKTAALSKYRFCGEVGGDRSAQLCFYPDEEAVIGKITLNEGYVLADLKHKDFPRLLSFRMREPVSSFFDASLDFAIEEHRELAGARGDAEVVARSGEIAPLTTASMAQVEAGLHPQRLEPHLLEFTKYASSKQSYDKVWLQKAAEALNDKVAAALDEKGVPSEQIPLLYDFARAVLLRQRQVINGVRKSQLQHIEDVVARVASAPNMHPDIATLVRLLGTLKGNYEGKIYEYKITVNLRSKGTGGKGFPLKLAGYKGTITIESLGRPEWNKQGNKSEASKAFDAYLAGVGVVAGKGAGSSLKGSATLQTIEDWAPGDFVGQIRLLDLSAGVGQKIGQTERNGKKSGGESLGLGVQGSSLVIIGSGSHQRMIAGFDWDIGKRGGIGAEFTMAFGAILDPAGNAKDDYTRKTVNYDLKVEKKERANVHFKFGSAILEPMGKALVRSFSAAWLRWVDSPESQLTVIGHADSVDTPERNRELSQMRAQNVIQAMKDVLGPKLRIPEGRIIAQAWGECDAYFHGEEDSRNRKFRRVDVALDGHCVLTLWVA